MDLALARAAYPDLTEEQLRRRGFIKASDGTPVEPGRYGRKIIGADGKVQAVVKNAVKLPDGSGFMTGLVKGHAEPDADDFGGPPDGDEDDMEKGSGLSRENAREILHEGGYHPGGGKKKIPIQSDAQRRFFGARASGQPVLKAEIRVCKSCRHETTAALLKCHRCGGEFEKAAPLGEGSRFKQLSAELFHKPGIRDPDAVAATTGRKKYGAGKTAELSHHGIHKAATGEGSRGGQVIAHTSSGKPIYAGNGESLASLGYAHGFSAQDHAEGADHHEREQTRHQAILSGLLRGMADKQKHYGERPPAVDHHGRKANHHAFYSAVHRVLSREQEHSLAAMETMGMAKAVLKAKAEHLLTVKVEDCPHCAVMLKAQQLGFFDERHEVGPSTSGASSSSGFPTGCPGCKEGKEGYPIGHRVRVFEGEHRGHELIVDNHEGGKLHGATQYGTRISVPPGSVRPGAGHEVKAPGSRGGRGYHDKEGKWRYGERPAGVRGVSNLSPVAESLAAKKEDEIRQRAQVDAHAQAYGNSPGWVRREGGKSERVRLFRDAKSPETVAGRIAQAHGQWNAGEHEQAAKLHESSAKFHREEAVSRDRDSAAALAAGKGDLARAHKVAAEGRRKVADLHEMHARAHRAIGGPVESAEKKPAAGGGQEWTTEAYGAVKIPTLDELRSRATGSHRDHPAYGPHHVRAIMRRHKVTIDDVASDADIPKRTVRQWMDHGAPAGIKAWEVSHHVHSAARRKAETA